MLFKSVGRLENTRCLLNEEGYGSAKSDVILNSKLISVSVCVCACDCLYASLSMADYPYPSFMLVWALQLKCMVCFQRPELILHLWPLIYEWMQIYVPPCLLFAVHDCGWGSSSSQMAVKANRMPSCPHGQDAERTLNSQNTGCQFFFLPLPRVLFFLLLSRISNRHWVLALILQKRATEQGAISLGTRCGNQMQWSVKSKFF